MDDRAAKRQQKKLEREQKRQALAEAREARLAEIRARNEERKAAEAQKREDRANAAVARARELRADPKARAKIDARLAARGASGKTPATKRFSAFLEGHEIKGDEYRKGFTKRIPIAGAVAEYESGIVKKRVTATRVLAGGILLGAIRKDKTKCYVAITFADGETAIIEAPIKAEKKARKFAATVNAAGAYYANRD